MTITRLATHNVNRTFWVDLMYQKALANPANDPGLDTVYYDGQMSCYRVSDYTGIPATWYPKAVTCRAPYRDYWYIGQGDGQGYRIFPQGLTEDWLRNANATSKGVVNTMTTTLYGIPSGSSVYGEPYLQGENGTRETAYALMAHLENIRCGVAANASRIATLYSYALAHVDSWTANSYTYKRPFMMALTSKALIQYYEQYSADAAIVTKLSALWESTWNTLWGAVDGNGSLSFKYTNVDTSTLSTTYTNSGGTIANPAYNSGGTEASTDLNLLIVPPFGWLYKQTADAKWQTRGDLIFDEGISVYSGGFQVRGAYLGSPTALGVQGKFVNQNFWWSDKYLEYTGSVPDTGTSTNSAIGNPIESTEGGGYYGGGTVITAPYTPSAYYTGGTFKYWFDGTAAPMVLNGSGLPANNTIPIQTVNPSIGTPTLFQSTLASQPIVTTGITNGRQGMTFDATKSLNITSGAALLNSATKISFGTVFRLNSTGANGQFHNCFDATWSVARFRPFLAAAQPALDASQTTAPITTANSSTTLSTVSAGGANLHAVLWQWDIAAGTLSIYANNAVTNINGAAFGTAGSMVATNSNGSAPLNMGASLGADVFETFLNVNSLMTAPQITAWFAAVKARFSLTNY